MADRCIWALPALTLLLALPCGVQAQSERPVVRVKAVADQESRFLEAVALEAGLGLDSRQEEVLVLLENEVVAALERFSVFRLRSTASLEAGVPQAFILATFSSDRCLTGRWPYCKLMLKLELRVRDSNSGGTWEEGLIAGSTRPIKLLDPQLLGGAPTKRPDILGAQGIVVNVLREIDSQVESLLAAVPIAASAGLSPDGSMRRMSTNLPVATAFGGPMMQPRTARAVFEVRTMLESSYDPVLFLDCGGHFVSGPVVSDVPTDPSDCRTPAAGGAASPTTPSLEGKQWNCVYLRHLW